MTNAPVDQVKGFDDEPAKKFKLPKWALISGIVIILIVAIALIIPMFLDQSRYKDLIITKVEESTGYRISWAGDLDIAILPTPHVTIHDATASASGQTILKIKEASVSVALIPLLSQKIEVSSVKMIEPDISLIVDASGRQTWMTEKLATQKNTDETSNSAQEKKSGNEFSVGNVHIENGNIVYKDLQKNSAQKISELDADADLSSLAGPFDLKTSLIWNGNKIEAEGKTGKIETGKPASVDMKIKLPDLDVSGNYKGEITGGDAMKVQGDLKLSARDLEKTLTALTKKETKLPEGLNGALDLTSAIMLDGDTAAIDKATIALGELAYEGNVKVTGLKSSASPQLSIDLTSTAKDPNSGAALVKALKNLNIKGSGTYLNNVATIDQGRINFDGQVINVSGSYSMPATSGARPRLNAKINSDRIDVDELTRQISPATESAAQKVVNERNAQSSTPTAISGASLPFDGNLQGQVGTLITGGKTYSNLNFNVTNAGDRLTITNLALTAPASTDVTARGVISDLKKLSGMDINATVKTANVENLAKIYNIPLNLEQNLGAASVSGNFKGSLDNLSFNATTNALNFAVTAAGNVKNALTVPQIDTLNVHIVHPSLQTAVRNFSPTFDAPGNFNGALDVSTSLSLKDKNYTLSNINGKLGGVTVVGEIAADMNGTKPTVDGDLTFGNMVFETPAPPPGGGSAASATKSASAGGESRWSREAIDTAWMNKFNASLKIKAGSITQGLWKLSNANLSFKLKEGNLFIDNMSAGAFGGTMAINGTMKSGDAKNPLSMNWAAKASSINAQQLISALQNKQSDVLSGTIKDFNVNIAATGLSPAALVYSLNGKGSASGTNIIVKGVDAAKLADAARGSYKPLERAGSLFASFKDGQTAFKTFDAAFDIASGIVRFSQIKFDGDQAMLTSTGNVNLPRWTIDLKNSMTVKNSDIPAFDFAISGPLDAPLQTGGSVIENFLRQKAQAKIQKLITDKIGDKLGIPLGGLGGSQPAATTTPSDTTAPAANSNGAAATDAPMTKEEKKAQQIQEGVKALQGLFGQ